MSITERLRKLRTQVALEQNPIKKHEMLEQLLQLLQECFCLFQLLQLLDNEESPKRLRLLTTEPNEIIEERKARRTGSSPPRAE